MVYFLQLYMFRTQSASIFRSNFLQTVVAATGVCYRYGVDKSRIGVIGSVCIIRGSIDVDGLAMLFVSSFLFPTSRGLACCINPQPGGPGYF